jgi:integrase
MQHGSPIQTSRKRGPDVWLFQWLEKDDEGRRICRKRVIETVEEYVSGDAARSSIAALTAKVNSANPQTVTDSMTFAQLRAHFEQRELATNNMWRSYATKKSYAVYLRRWLVRNLLVLSNL